jgi:hypothetical protein
VEEEDVELGISTQQINALPKVCHKLRRGPLAREVQVRHSLHVQTSLFADGETQPDGGRSQRANRKGQGSPDEEQCRVGGLPGPEGSRPPNLSNKEVCVAIWAFERGRGKLLRPRCTSDAQRICAAGRSTRASRPPRSCSAITSARARVQTKSTKSRRRCGGAPMHSRPSSMTLSKRWKVHTRVAYPCAHCFLHIGLWRTRRATVGYARSPSRNSVAVAGQPSIVGQTSRPLPAAGFQRSRSTPKQKTPFKATSAQPSPRADQGMPQAAPVLVDAGLHAPIDAMRCSCQGRRRARLYCRRQ